MGAGYCHTCGILGAPKYWRDVTGCREQKHNVTERSDTMSEQGKHTAGPWRVEPGLMQRIIAPNGEPVALPCSGLTTSAPINARLIAAAPEMLEALRKVAMLLERLHGQEEKVKAGSLCSIGHYADYHAENITTIIRKATGEGA